jgi:chromosome segregation ATPase
VLLARQINEIALKMVDLRTELETLDEEMKAKAHQLDEVDRGIRALRVVKHSARHAGRSVDMNRHPPS